MKTWCCTSFKGFYPVGTSAVVVSSTKARARKLLHEALVKHGLPGLADDDELIEVKKGAVILDDGEY